MLPVFKREKVILSIPYCPHCDEIFITLPDNEYKCSCGIWEPHWELKSVTNEPDGEVK